MRHFSDFLAIEMQMQGSFVTRAFVLRMQFSSSERCYFQGLKDGETMKILQLKILKN